MKSHKPELLLHKISAATYSISPLCIFYHRNY